MARDYLALVKIVEGLYYKTGGGTAGDEILRQQLVGYANFAQREIERMQRWRLGWRTATQTTTAGTDTYQLPADFSTPKRLWYVTASGGQQELELLEDRELRAVFGEGPLAPRGSPRYWAYQPPNPSAVVNLTTQPVDLNPGAAGTYQLFPTPDNAGPSSGNYPLQLDYYAELGQIAETAGQVTLGNPTLTFSAAGAGNYLLSVGMPATSGPLTLSIRGAGYATGIVAAPNLTDDLVCSWNALVANTVQLGTGSAPLNSPSTSVGAGQVFFNSSNWLIRSFPKVPLFAMLREVASYLFADQTYQKWETRYQHELELLVDWENDADHTDEVLAAGVAGQRSKVLQDIDLPTLYEIRR
jgi:hypothetical protein